MQACPGCGRTFVRGRFCTADGCALVERSPGAARSSSAAWSAPGDPLDPLVGAVVDGFRIDSVLGRGATGTVYRATQLALARPVALKVLHGALAWDIEMVERFHREARAVARISHPGVVAVLAVGTCDGRPYLAMELVDGTTLERLLDDGPLPAARAAALGAQIAHALAHTHAAGVVHRDLKPANVMLAGAAGDHVVLVDFGIARTLDDEPRLTAGGIALGTPHYMAPEQVLGERVDARTDVYALGVVLYRMLTGDVPFDGGGMQVMMAHLNLPPAPLRGVPPAMAALVARCLAKRPDDRWSSAAEVAAALDALIGGDDGVSDAAATGVRHRPARMTTDYFGTAVWESGAHQRRGGWWLATLLTVLVLAGAGWTRWQPELLELAATAGLDLAPDADVELGPVLDSAAEALPRAVLVQSSGIAMRARLPAAIAAGEPFDIELELWDGDGAAIRAPEAVVTVVDPDGATRGLGAPALSPGRYRFRASLPRAGQHLLQVFVLDDDATLAIPFAVESRRPTS